MYEFFEWIDSGQIWSWLGVLSISCGFCSIMFASLMTSGPVTAFVVIGCIFIILGIYSIYYKNHFKRKLSYDTYKQLTLLKEVKILCDCSNKYLNFLENDCDYSKLKELFKYLPVLYNAYYRQILDTPLQLSKPVSPSTAAFWGTQLGGTAVGIVAAQNAIENQKKYEQNKWDVFSSKQDTKNALNKLQDCYSNIEIIIRKNQAAKTDWEKEKATIQTELANQYRIPHLGIVVQNQTDSICKQNTTTTTIAQQKRQNISNESEKLRVSSDNRIMSQKEFEAKERQLLGKIR